MRFLSSFHTICGPSECVFVGPVRSTQQPTVQLETAPAPFSPERISTGTKMDEWILESYTTHKTNFT